MNHIQGTRPVRPLNKPYAPTDRKPPVQRYTARPKAVPQQNYRIRDDIVDVGEIPRYFDIDPHALPNVTTKHKARPNQEPQQ